MDLDAIARELYGADRDAFTAARDARARALKAAGEPQLARQVAALRRPTVAAAVVNLLARAEPERVAALLHIGDEMRQAADAGALRRLVEQQRGEVAALVRLARGVAREHGLTVSESTAAAVEGTLRAAVADRDVAAQVTAGALAKEQQPSGFPLSPPAGAGASGDGSMGAAAREDDDPTQAVAALAQAQALLDDAEQMRGQAVQEAVAAAARRDVVAEELARLRAQVGEAEQRAEQAERDLDEARLREAHATEQARRAAEEVARVRRAGPRPPGRRSTP